MQFSIWIPPTLAVNAIEGAQFCIIWQQIDTQRDSQSSADQWAKDGLIK
jgi:hypothetical protein